MSKPLKDCAMYLLQPNLGPHEATVVLEGGDVVFTGRLEIAQRLIICWNVQLNRDEKEIRRPK